MNLQHPQQYNINFNNNINKLQTISSTQPNNYHHHHHIPKKMNIFLPNQQYQQKQQILPSQQLYMEKYNNLLLAIKNPTPINFGFQQQFFKIPPQLSPASSITTSRSFSSVNGYDDDSSSISSLSSSSSSLAHNNISPNLKPQNYQYQQQQQQNKRLRQQSSSLTNNNKKKKTSTSPKFWTKSEDELLIKAVKEHGAKNWKLISSFIESRNSTQCQQRWSKVLVPGLKKGPWGDDEDEQLLNLVNKQLNSKDIKYQVCKNNINKRQPKINWKIVSENINGRTAKQCRARWTNNLNPTLRKGNWTPDEDAKIMQLQKLNGSKWAYIASQLEDRSENAVKIRFVSLTRYLNKKRQQQ